MKLTRLLIAAIAFALPGCSLPDVNLATAEPLKVDVNVRLDVYQYGTPAKVGTDDEPKDVASVTERRRNRMAEITRFKGERSVGENHRGLLTIRELPAGNDGDYLKKTVEEENSDRVFLMVEQAKKDNVQLHVIQDREWKLSSERAYEGEWLEVADTEKPGSYKWVKKAAN